MPERRSGFAELEGGPLHYEIGGDGPPVVLIHAGLWDLRIWDEQVDAFTKAGHTVVRYDLRGFGRSAPPTVPFSFRQELADLLAHLDIPRASVVGASMGGGIALDFALEFPAMVEALVLVAPGVGGDDTPDDERTARLLGESEAVFEAGDHARAVEIALDVWCPLRTDPDVDGRIHDIAMDNMDVDGLDWSLSRRMEPPAAARLHQVAVPTLVIAGDSDAPVMATICQKLAAGIPGARLTVIEGADHLPNMRRPDVFDRLVLDFLTSVRAG
jgi:pimeloyl-ACP methyl ester carboxylesterase